MLNKVMIIGNLGQDPEEKNNGVVKFSIATTENWKDKSGEKQSKTEWHNIVMFSKQGEIASKYLKKGSKIYLEGKLTTNTWEKEGEKRYSTEIHAFNFQMLDKKPEGATAAVSTTTEVDDDLPF